MLAPTPIQPQTKIVTGDCLTLLRTMHDSTVHCVITSPPYFGLRDYGNAEQIGLEASPQEYIAKLVEVFREVRRVLRADGTCWLNLGDSYAGSGRGGNPNAGTKQGTNKGSQTVGVLYGLQESAAAAAERERMQQQFAALKEGGLKQKDLIGIPWRVALALQADGWYLRQDIIWHKPNPMPESVRDRCTKAHEYLFLLTKSDRYYFDPEAIAEPSIYAPGKTHEVERAKGYYDGKYSEPQAGRNDQSFKAIRATRNKRSVWTIAPKPYKEAHFATFPPALVEPCLLAGTNEAGCCSTCAASYKRLVKRKSMVIDKSERTHELGRTRSSGTMLKPATTTTLGWQPSCKCASSLPAPSVVLDPFAGAGTVGVVAKQHKRHFVGFELNPTYADMARKRIANS